MSREGHVVGFDLPEDDQYTTNQWLETGVNLDTNNYQAERPDSTQANNINILSKYFQSSKGQELMKGMSTMYGVSMIVIGLALMMSEVLDADNVDVCDTSYFYTYMYLLSSTFILTILVLGACDRLTNDQHYRDQKSVTFIRIGAVVLATGGVIYEFTNIIVYAYCPAECQIRARLLSACAAILFMLFEIVLLLNYSRLRINKGTLLSTGGQLICMQIVATNMCVWVQTVIFETMEDIERRDDHANDEGEWDNYTEYADNISVGCSKGQELQHLLSPYLFPFLIEYSVIAAIMVIAIWEKCGSAPHDNTKESTNGDVMDEVEERKRSMENHENRRGSLEGGLSISSFAGGLSNFSARKDAEPKKYYNNHRGFIIGWVTVVISLVIIIGYLFVTYSTSDYGDTIEIVVYTWDLLVNLLCLLAIAVTMYKMAELTWKDQEIKLLRSLKLRHSFKYTTASHIHRDLDKMLLNVTFVALAIFFTFVMISSDAHDSWIIFANALVSVVMSALQTMFINWYGVHKRATKVEHLEQKPGRQGLEVIRCCNLALWAVNTFIIKHPENKKMHQETFGFTAWVIISNITQPLTILFYFHSSACVAEIISHSYTKKYVGIRRHTYISSVSDLQGLDGAGSTSTESESPEELQTAM